MKIEFKNKELETSNLGKLIKKLDEYENFKYPKDRSFLVPFLRVRKYDINAAAQTVIKFFIQRDSLFRSMNLIPKDHQDLLRCDYGGLLKSRDPLGRPIYVHEGVWNIKDGHGFDDLLLYVCFLMLEIFRRVEVQNEGLVMVLDYSKLSWAHYKQIGLGKLRTLINLYDSLPISVKQVHVVYNPMVFNLMYSMGKPFMKEKLKQRINIHGQDLTLFHEALPKNILPKSLGGDLTNEEAYNMNIIENMLQKNDEYEEFLKYGYQSDLGEDCIAVE